MIAVRPTLEEAKTRFDVPALWSTLGLPGRPGRSIRCPFHEDRSASFSVYPGNRGESRFKCFAGCGEGGPVELVCLALDLPVREACRWLLDRASGESAGEVVMAPRPKVLLAAEPARRLILPAGLDRGTPADRRRLAALRGLSVDAVDIATQHGLLRFGRACGFPAWFVVDDRRINAQARRMDGELFPAFKSADKELPARKSHTLGGSQAGWPIGTREAESFPFVALVEGAPDLLAAFHFIAAERREADVAPVAMLGAANRIPEDALLLLANKRIRLFPHADPAGAGAAIRWTAQLERVGCEVDAFRFEGLRRCDGGAVGDLNDLALVDADDYEAEQAELAEVLPR